MIVISVSDLHPVGYVLQGRYKSIVVEKESHLLELCRYVVLNPLRARMVRSVRDWRWSSYRATAGYVKAPAWLATDWVLSQFGKSREGARVAYRQFVREGLKASSPWESVHGQIWLGSEEFRARMARLVAGQDLNDVPSMQTQPARPTPEALLGAVAQSFEVKREAVLDRAYQPAFQAAVYLLRRVANLPLKDVSALAGVSISRISRIQSTIERQGPDGPLEDLVARYKV